MQVEFVIGELSSRMVTERFNKGGNGPIPEAPTRIQIRDPLSIRA